MSGATRAHLALSAVALIYGANYVIAKSVMPDPIGPNSFIVLRVFGAALLFWLITNRRMMWPQRRDWPRFVACALTGVVINQLLFFNGLALTSPINSSIIMTSNPILVMLLYAAWNRRRIPWIRMLGVGFGAAGAVSLLLLSAADTVQLSHPLGDAFILINSLSYAFYLVMLKPLMGRYPPLVIITWVFTIGFVCVLPFGGWGLQEVPWHNLNGWQWASVGYVIVCVTFLTYLLNIVAIGHSSPTLASAYIYFQPMLAAMFSWFFASLQGVDYTSDITWMKAGCAGLIFFGVYLVGREKKAVH